MDSEADHSGEIREYRAEEEDAGKRLDLVLAGAFPALSRAFIRVLPTLVVTPESWLVTNLFARINPAWEEVSAQLLALFFLALVLLCLCMKNVRRRITEAEHHRFASLPLALFFSVLLVWSVLSFTGVSSFLYFQY